MISRRRVLISARCAEKGVDGDLPDCHSERGLRCRVEVGCVVVYGLHSLYGVNDLSGQCEADLHADIVSGENFLALDVKQGLAVVDREKAEIPSPEDVASRSECPRQLALVIEQADESLVNDGDLPPACDDRSDCDRRG